MDASERLAGAREHQRVLELKANGIGVAFLHARWKLSETTIREIPRAHLQYMEFGKGRKNKRRRYRLEDVETYEAWLLAGKPGDPPFAQVA